MTKLGFLSFFYKNSLGFAWIIVFATSFFVLFTHSISFLDPDFGWHLRVGKDISQTKSAPQIESYTYPTLGQNWVDHEWLGNYLLYKVYASGKFGYWMLGAIFSFVTIGIFVLTTYFTKKLLLPKTNSWRFLFFCSPIIILNSYAIITAFGIRLQVVSWMFLILLCTIFISSQIKKKPWPLVFAPLLMWFWANIHGTFFIGLFLLAALLLFGLLFLKKTKKIKLFYFYTFLASFIATFFTPYNYKLWQLVLGEYTQNKGYLMQIKEWLPMYAAPYIEWYSGIYISFFLALLMIGFLGKFVPKKAGLIFYLSLVLLLLFAAIQARRFFALFVIFSFPAIIFLLINIFSDFKIRRSFAWVVVLLGSILIPLKISYIQTVPLNLFTQNIESSPHKALVFLRAHNELDRYNIYNHYAWGGYLDWMWPERKLFIDGRMPQRPLKNGNTFLEEYLSFAREDTIRDKLKQHNIKIAFFPVHKPLETANKLEKHLLEQFFLVDLKKFNEKPYMYGYYEENWQKIFEDNVSLIYVHPDVAVIN